ncbi:Myosin heavy chain kinase B [Diplonema papillatum]|nr:Myosin heavy chain kinase B [Diplonema papillatum]
MMEASPSPRRVEPRISSPPCPSIRRSRSKPSAPLNPQVQRHQDNTTYAGLSTVPAITDRSSANRALMEAKGAAKLGYSRPVGADNSFFRCVAKVKDLMWVAETDGTITTRDPRTAEVKKVLDSSALDKAVNSRIQITQDELCTKAPGHILTMTAVGTQVWAGTNDGKTVVFNGVTGRREHELKHHSGPVTCIAAYNGRVFTGSSDFKVCQWDAVRCAHVKTMHGHKMAVRCLHCTGPLVFSGSDDKTINAWSSTAANLLATLVGHKADVLAVTSCLDNLWSGSVDCTVKVWNGETGHCKVTHPYHTGWVHALKCVGTRVLSASHDGSVCVWNGRKLTLLHRIETAHDGLLHDIHLSMVVQEATVWTVGADQIVRFWSVTETLLDQPVEYNELEACRERALQLQAGLRAQEEKHTQLTQTLEAAHALLLKEKRGRELVAVKVAELEQDRRDKDESIRELMQSYEALAKRHEKMRQLSTSFRENVQAMLDQKSREFAAGAAREGSVSPQLLTRSLDRIDDLKRENKKLSHECYQGSTDTESLQAEVHRLQQMVEMRGAIIDSLRQRRREETGEGSSDDDDDDRDPPSHPRTPPVRADSFAGSVAVSPQRDAASTREAKQASRKCAVLKALLPFLSRDTPAELIEAAHAESQPFSDPSHLHHHHHQRQQQQAPVTPPMPPAAPATPVPATVPSLDVANDRWAGRDYLRVVEPAPAPPRRESAGEESLQFWNLDKNQLWPPSPASRQTQQQQPHPGSFGRFPVVPSTSPSFRNLSSPAVAQSPGRGVEAEGASEFGKEAHRLQGELARANASNKAKVEQLRGHLEAREAELRELRAEVALARTQPSRSSSPGQSPNNRSGSAGGGSSGRAFDRGQFQRDTLELELAAAVAEKVIAEQTHDRLQQHVSELQDELRRKDSEITTLEELYEADRPGDKEANKETLSLKAELTRLKRQLITLQLVPGRRAAAFFDGRSVVATVNAPPNADGLVLLESNGEVVLCPVEMVQSVLLETSEPGSDAGQPDGSAAERGQLAQPVREPADGLSAAAPAQPKAGEGQLSTGEREALELKIESLESDLQLVVDQLGQSKESINVMADTCEDLSNERTRLTADLQGAKEEQNAMLTLLDQDKQRIQELEKEVEKLRESSGAPAGTDGLKQKLKTCEQHLASAQRKNKDLKEQMNSRVKHIEEGLAAAKAAKELNLNKQAEIANLQDEVGFLHRALELEKSSKERLAAEVHMVKQEINAEKERADQLSYEVRARSESQARDRQHEEHAAQYTQELLGNLDKSRARIAELEACERKLRDTEASLSTEKEKSTKLGREIEKKDSDLRELDLRLQLRTKEIELMKVKEEKLHGARPRKAGEDSLTVSSDGSPKAREASLREHSHRVVTDGVEHRSESRVLPRDVSEPPSLRDGSEEVRVEVSVRSESRARHRDTNPPQTQPPRDHPPAAPHGKDSGTPVRAIPLPSIPPPPEAPHHRNRAPPPPPPPPVNPLPTQQLQAELGGGAAEAYDREEYPSSRLPLDELRMQVDDARRLAEEGHAAAESLRVHSAQHLASPVKVRLLRAIKFKSGKVAQEGALGTVNRASGGTPGTVRVLLDDLGVLFDFKTTDLQVVEAAAGRYSAGSAYSPSPQRASARASGSPSRSQRPSSLSPRSPPPANLGPLVVLTQPHHSGGKMFPPGTWVHLLSRSNDTCAVKIVYNDTVPASQPALYAHKVPVTHLDFVQLPPKLYVSVPKKPPADGCYKLMEDILHNDFPMWAAGERRIRTNSFGAWMIGDQADLVDGVGWAVSKFAHDGLMPHLVGVWQTFTDPSEPWGDDFTVRVLVQPHKTDPAAAAPLPSSSATLSPGSGPHARSPRARSSGSSITTEAQQAAIALSGVDTARSWHKVAEKARHISLRPPSHQ